MQLRILIIPWNLVVGWIQPRKFRGRKLVRIESVAQAAEKAIYFVIPN
jgi:hypothetical protein